MLPEKSKAGVAVLEGLAEREEDAEQDGADEAVPDALLVALEERMVRPGHRRARGQEDQRIEERQVPGIEGLDPLRRPDAADDLGAGELVRLVGEQGDVEIGPEPRDEEHHLGGDEQDHAVAMVHLHDGRVVAMLGFLDDVPPPHQHGVEHADQRRRRRRAAPRRPCASR